MKSKEVDEFYDDCSPTCLSNPSRKFRRVDYLSSWGIAKPEESEEDGTSKEKSSEGSRDSLAVVPRVTSHWPVVCEERLSAACEPLDAEGQMMDVDEPYVSRSEERDIEIGEKIEAVGVMPPCQQQHHMMLSLSPNTYSRMRW